MGQWNCHKGIFNIAIIMKILFDVYSVHDQKINCNK